MVQEWLGVGKEERQADTAPPWSPSPPSLPGAGCLLPPLTASGCFLGPGPGPLKGAFTTWPVPLSASELPCIWVASPTLPTFCKPSFPGPFGASSCTHTWAGSIACHRVKRVPARPELARAGGGGGMHAADGRSQCLSCLPLFCKRKCSFDGHLIPEAATCFLSLFTQKIKCGCACAAAIIISLGPRECGWNGRTLGSSKRDNY